MSEIFPLETRAAAIAFVYAIGTLIGGAVAPPIFGALIGTREPAMLALAWGVGAALMIAGGLVEIVLGVDAEGKSLEEIAAPLTAGGARGSRGVASGARRPRYWYRDAVVYQTHVKAFQDSNGDGVGDVRGLTSRLDYLAELGITALWLLPFFPSPLRDDGYDIADYIGVHESYGTLEDVRALVDAAHERGIRVIAELVVNHTSDQHPWFQRARRAPRGSPERAWYVWSDDDRAIRRDAHHLHRYRAVELGLGPGRRPVLLAPLLLAPARSELSEPRGDRRDHRRDAVLVEAPVSTASGSTRCRICASAKGRTTRTCPRRTR